MSKEEFDKLLERYLGNRCTAEEQKIVSRWYNNLSDGHEEYPEDQLSAIESDLWSKIESTISKPEPHTKAGPAPKSNRHWAMIGIAAALMLMTVVGVYLLKPVRETNLATVDSEPVIEKSGQVVIRNHDKKVVKPVRLSDGSLIILQPKSEINFDQSFSAGNREINLVGEAFFEIQRDPEHPFVIHSQGLVTKVLGTSFNIKAKPGDRTIVVDVKTGKVAVYKENKGNNEPEVHLTPNQQVIFDRSSEKLLKQLQEDPQVIITEKEMEEMRFDDAEVSQVFDAIEKAYGVKLDYDRATFRNCSLTTRMTNEGLKEKLEIICKALGATYEFEGTMIVISGSGCQ